MDGKQDKTKNLPPNSLGEADEVAVQPDAAVGDTAEPKAGRKDLKTSAKPKTSDGGAGHKKKKKKKRKPISRKLLILIILVGIVGLLVGGYYVLQAYNTAKNQQDAIDRAMEDYFNNINIQISCLDNDAINTIEYTYDGEDVRLEQTDSGWRSIDQPDAKLNQTYMDTILAFLADVKATRLVETGTAGFAKYGMDKPYMDIHITMNNDKVYHWLIGEQNPVTKDYYLYDEDMDTVYTIGVSMPTAFSHHLSDMLVQDDANS